MNRYPETCVASGSGVSRREFIGGTLAAGAVVGGALLASQPLMSLRRRLVISQEGLAYTGDFSFLRVKWSEVKYIETRRSGANLFWKSEGLVIRTDLPDAKEHFVDLQQFSRNWRHEPLGQVLQMKAPHLFPSHISK